MTGYCNTPSNPTEEVIWVSREVNVDVAAVSQPSPRRSRFAPLAPIRQRLDQIKIGDRQVARRICTYIPARCPFERTIKLFGWTVLRIPPLCKLNPFYEEFVGLRFRALCYLADECQEDISEFC